MTAYRYEAVTHCGAGVDTRAPTTLPKALRVLAKAIARGAEDAEIQRVLTSDDGYSHRYWLRRGGRWRVYPDRAFEPTDSDYAYWRERAQREANP